MPARENFRFRKEPLGQLSLFQEGDVPADLHIVDIRDDPERGMELVCRLSREEGRSVIVVAPGPDWAMEAYDADVAAYLLDPPDAARAASLILRWFSARLTPQETQFSFRTPGGIRFLPGERIVYLEYSNHRMIIHTDHGKPISTTTMRQSFGDAAAALLKKPQFVRTHASFVVNIQHVSRFNKGTLTMDTGASVPISHARLSEVKRLFGEFLGR